MMSNLRINRGGAGDVETFAMANCLMILSSQTAAAAAAAAAATTDSHSSAAAATDFTRMFACKTCGKKFSSFQALGGHRASHKKIKPSLPSANGKPSSPPKPKTHVCTICSAEFSIGQALGGHMRRHRPLLPSGAGDGAGVTAAGSTITTEGSTEKSDGNNNSSGEKKRKSDGDNNDDNGVVKLMKTSSCKRGGLDLNLDLNLNHSFWGNPEIIYHEEDEHEVEEGEIVEQADEEDEEKDFLKLELRPPTINW